MGKDAMTTVPNTREVKFVPIGNSKGIRIPKELRLKYGWGEELVLEECENGILLQAGNTGKLSWEDTYRAMAAADEDWDDFDVASADGLDRCPNSPSDMKSGAPISTPR